MKTARQLLEEFIASSFKDPQQAAAMFAEDGAFEMPYLADLGFTPAYRGGGAGIPVGAVKGRDRPRHGIEPRGQDPAPNPRVRGGPGRSPGWPHQRE
jgi:hypothetical protein